MYMLYTHDNYNNSIIATMVCHRLLMLYTVYRKRFSNSTDNLKRYRVHFSEWKRLPYAERLRHRYKDCRECASLHRAWFELKDVNKPFCHDTEEKLLDVEQMEELITGAAVQTSRSTMQIRNERTPKRGRSSLACRRKELERKIISCQMRKFRAERKTSELNALFTTNTSRRDFDKHRRIQYGEYRPTRVRKHISPLHKYTLNANRAKDILGEDLDIGRSMAGKWAGMAREVHLRNRDGKPADDFNGSQVCFKDQVRFSNKPVSGI